VRAVVANQYALIGKMRRARSDASYLLCRARSRFR
jgi:hypothetical protein